ncbi:helix-turn-helix transcriptional regulator [Candidatus Peregrinibacteria bacterium]|nr:helix-turn-helix transcriptional regulator [Candidatus Peregrinibacteria bacterium]
MDNKVKKSLGQKIRGKREQLGLSQTELAQSVHKSSPAYIAFIEAGERNVSAMDLMLIAKKLGTTVSELMGENQKIEKPEVMQALRADKDLKPEDRRTIEEYYLLLKNKDENK